jgi:hypothetical protein
MLTNCTFRNNSAGWGGGAIDNVSWDEYTESSPVVTKCTFIGNSAGWDGGGMENASSHPTLTNCIFYENLSERDGGGMSNSDSSHPNVTNCMFSGNSANRHSGGMDNKQSSPTLINCIFSGNSANNNGGGMRNRDDSHPDIRNCTFTGNSATNSGGGMRNYKSNPTLTNCIFSENSAGKWSTGISNTNSSNPVLRNCILWGNTSEHIPLIHQGNTSLVTITYSDVQGGWPGQGNINADPLFANPGYWNQNSTPEDPNDDFWVDGDYHLKSEMGRRDPNSESWVEDDMTSPCIDTGDPNSDFADETWPHGGRINMGAYGGMCEASMSMETEGMMLPNVAYIHYEEDASAVDYQSLLNSYGCSTTLIPSHEIVTTGLYAYDLIIVGTDTGYLTTWMDEQNVAAVESSGKPVVGLGNGGYWYFGQLGLSIGKPYGGNGIKNSIEVIDPNSSLFNTPYAVDIQQDLTLQLYTETNHIGIYLWPTLPETVTGFGREVNDAGYYPLVAEHKRYMFWGFTESPQKMTEVGKMLFINIVINVANGTWGS